MQKGAFSILVTILGGAFIGFLLALWVIWSMSP